MNAANGIYVPCYDPNPLPADPGVHMQLPPKLRVQPMSVNHVRVTIEGEQVIVDAITLRHAIEACLDVARRARHPKLLARE